MRKIKIPENTEQMVIVKNLGLRPHRKKNRTYLLIMCPTCKQTREMLAKVVLKSRRTFCAACAQKTHCKSKTRLYRIWYHIKQRCQNPNDQDYKHYGGRGVCLCPQWQLFELFDIWANANGYQEDLEIDRIDVNGHYEPDNCRWVTRQINVINRRRSKSNKSGFTGVCFDKKSNKWRAYITHGENRKVIGWFDDLANAVAERDEYIIRNNLPHKLQSPNQPRGLIV